MRTKLFLSVLVCFSFFSLGATANDEEGKEVVYVDYFTRTSNIGSSFAEALRSKVLESIQKTNRVHLVDVDAQDALKVEAERRKDESAMGDETARNAQMKSLGANYIIKGHAVSMNTVKRTDDKGNVSYKGSISYTIKIVDTSDGKIIATETFSHEGLTGGTGKTQEDAIVSTFGYVNLEKFIDTHFAIQGGIVQIESVKKDKADQVYIDLGTNRGVLKGQRFRVYLETEIAGEMSKKEIGALNAKEVVSGKRTLCKVTKGGDAIKTANDNNQALIVVSVPKGLFQF